MRKEAIIIADAKDLTHTEWLMKRKEGIGGSDVAKLLGISPWATPLDLFIDKTTATLPKEADNWFMLSYGNAIEPLVREWYQRASGYTVINDTNMYRHPDYPWMMADVDFIAITPSGEKIGGEIKSTTPASAAENWAPGILGMGGKLPLYYEVQVRHYMAVLDLNRFVVLCIFGNSDSQIIPVQVYRDMEREEELIRAESDFWNGYVLTGTAPEGGITKASLEILRKESEEEGRKDEDLILDSSAESLLESYLSLKEEEKGYREKLAEIGKQLDAKTAEIVRVTSGFQTARLDRGDEYIFVKNNTIHKWIPDTDKIKLNFPDVWESVKKEVTYDTTSVKLKKAKPAKEASA